MAIATVSTKGQITLPAELRRRLGIEAHDRVLVEATEDTIVIRRAGDFFELSGFLGKALPEVREREAMLRAVAEHAEGGQE
jgi:AbrB family looped-hinge helix DNA binding protein